MMQENSNPNVNTVTAGADGLINKIQQVSEAIAKLVTNADGVGQTIIKGFNEASNFEQKLVAGSRALGLSRDFSRRIGDDLAKAGINVLQMGGSLDDVVETFTKMNSELQKATYFSVNFLSNVQAVKEFGVGEETITTFVKFFDKVGGGMDQAMERSIQLVNTAQSYGLNAGKFVADVASKMDLLNKYGFPKGVEDLSAMVVKSKMLGDTLSVAQTMADQIMDTPEKAYEMAAQLQTLGGSFSQLGDGAQLLYMAQNDLQGLQDQIIKATRGIATFNQETGQFQISTQERLRLKQLKNLGMDVDKVEETALKLAKQEKIIREMSFVPNNPFGGLSEEEKTTLASYAQIGKGGKITIEGKEIGGMNAAEVKNIFETLTNSGKQLKEDVASNIKTVGDNLSSNERVTMSLNKLNNAYAVGVLSTTNFYQTLDKIAAPVENLNGRISGLISSLARAESPMLNQAVTTVVGAMQTAINAGTGNLPTGTGSIPVYESRVSGDVTVKVEGIDAKLSDLIKGNLETYVRSVVEQSVANLRPPRRGGYSR